MAMIKLQRIPRHTALAQSRPYVREPSASCKRRLSARMVMQSRCGPIRTVLRPSRYTIAYRLSQSQPLFRISPGSLYTTVIRMAPSFSKELVQSGDGTTYPKVGDMVTIEYTGWLYDTSAKNNRGTSFDSSVGRGDFKTAIGTGKVIQGWDQGVPQMTLGEKAILTIPGDMAYGSRGFPGLIPPNATLIFEVHLKAINDRAA